MSSILDQLTDTQYDAIATAHDAMQRANKAAHQGFGPDWGAIAIYREAEAAFDGACEAAGFAPAEILLEL
ncbi:hypothetical protein [Nocardiopsis rhodophaea]|uniref:hypothetical protein n=1 Tax=Nocardiopsis rhodophaea TaxID=280238 RepID=UPI0031E08C8B